MKMLDENASNFCANDCATNLLKQRFIIALLMFILHAEQFCCCILPQWGFSSASLYSSSRKSRSNSDAALIRALGGKLGFTMINIGY
jgi:hypothetical protein